MIDNEDIEADSGPSPRPEAEIHLDSRRLSEAVIQLNIARRNVGMYPPGHAQVEQSVASAHAVLHEMLSTWPEITLGVAKDTLLVGDEHLDRNNPVYRDFAVSLNSREIAAVTFVRGLRTEEVESFAKILTTDPEKIRANGGIEKIVSEAQIANIIIQRLDYSGFHLTEEDEIGIPEGEKQSADATMWQDFVSQLVSGTFDSSDQGVLLKDSTEIDPAQLAAFLNEGKLDAKAVLQTYETIIAQHVRSAAERDQLTEEQSNTLANMLNLVQNLTPNIKKQFLSVSSEHFMSEKLPPAAEDLLEGFPDNMVIEMLRQASEEGRPIPQRMMEIVQRISFTDDEGQSDISRKTVDAAKEEHLPEMSQDHVKTLFEEERDVSTGETEYDATLEALTRGGMAEEKRPEGAFPIEDYLETLEESHVNLQLGQALLAFMKRRIDDGNYKKLLGRLFALLPDLLENGSFLLLLEFLETLRSHSEEKAQPDLTAGPEGAGSQKTAKISKQQSNGTREAASKALKVFYEPAIVSKAVSAFGRWGDTKGKEASGFLLSLGPTTIPELMELYADLESPDEFEALYKLLVDFGEAAATAAQHRLNDTRSHYVRNLLILLQEAGTAEALPHVKPLAHHENQEVRMAALSILIKFKDPTGTILLREALLSRDKDVSSQALLLAGRYGGGGVVEDLVSMLKIRPLLRSGYAANEKIVKALGEIGDPQAIPVLEKLARSKWKLYPKSLSSMKVALFESLERYPRESLEELLHMGRRSDNARTRKAVRSIIERPSTQQV